MPMDCQFLEWPDLPKSTSETVTSDLGWDLAPLPFTTRAVADFVHIAAGAYMTDRCTPRGVRFSRDLSLNVVVAALDSWTADVLDAISGLLGWLSGDTWTVNVIPATDTAVVEDEPPQHSCGPVSLLSGGLDSFLGAIDLLGTGSQPTFVGHKDTASAVRQAQRVAWTWLATNYQEVPPYSRFALAQAGPRAESSSRTRSLLFVALGVTVAVSTGATRLVVPENGYTGINLPLRSNRGGALSTRSTHPDTFRRIAEILDALDIAVSIENPFEWLTKGEAMIKVAGQAPPPGWADAAALTLSCSKLNGRWMGGPSNRNCGLCVPCMVRRATFVRADVSDGTIYLHETLSGKNLKQLIDARRGDIEAVKYAIERGVDSDAIDAGTWPNGYDLDRVESLVQRGLDELALLPLP